MIVVGIDGSEGGVAALEFAADEAALRKARLRIVVAWELPVATDRSGFGPPLDPAVREQLEEFVVRRRAELGD